MFALLACLCIFSCQKDEPTDSGPVIVMDQAQIEAQLPGSWRGILSGSNNYQESLNVVIDNMVLGEKVAAGDYSEPGFSCNFEWVYESLTSGKVTFRESTPNPDECEDGLAVIVHFEDDDFDVIHVYVSTPIGDIEGELTRQ